MVGLKFMSSVLHHHITIKLKSDYGRIEIKKLLGYIYVHFSLKSDYGRIEMHYCIFA